MFNFLTQPASTVPVIAAKLNDGGVVHFQENVGSIIFAERHGYPIMAACGRMIHPSAIYLLCVGNQHEILLPMHIMPSYKKARE